MAPGGTLLLLAVMAFNYALHGSLIFMNKHEWQKWPSTVAGIVAVWSLLTIACCFEIDAVAVGTQADTLKCLRLQLPFLNLRTRTHINMDSAW